MENTFNIENFLSLETYATDERKKRRKGSKGSLEFFTPYKLIEKMTSKISPEKWNNPEANFLEPSFGNGNFVIYIIYNKIKHGSTWEQALSHTYGVELIESNVIETHNKIIEMLYKMNVPNFNENIARKIIKYTLVCSNFFDWDFQHWRPIKEPKCESLF